MDLAVTEKDEAVQAPVQDEKEGNCSEQDAGKLRARWLEENSSGTTLRDTVLQTLRTSCGKGDRDRPRDLDLRGINLSGEEISGLDLSGYDLSYADLTGANLIASNLSWTKLHKASLASAALEDCQLLGADLTSANLSECSAERAGFGASDLRGASFIKAHLQDVTLSESKLCQADFRAADLRGARFRNADLEEADFTRADLRSADFEEAIVSGTLFNEADMRKARLRGVKKFETASWLGTDISEVDFCGAYLVRRHIMDENYLLEFRSRSRYNRAFYWVWWVTSDCGRSAGRWVTWIAGIAIFFAFLYSVVDIDYGPHETPFSPMYFSIVTLTTLGFGDVFPASTAAQFLAAIEALMGYVGLGGLLSILSAKMARRAD